MASNWVRGLYLPKSEPDFRSEVLERASSHHRAVTATWLDGAVSTDRYEQSLAAFKDVWEREKCHASSQDAKP